MSQYHQSSVRVALEHCTIAREDGSLICGMLINISDEDFCIETNRPLELGERIEMRVVGLGRIVGLIRWCDTKRVGGVLEPYSRELADCSAAASSSGRPLRVEGGP